MRLSLELLNVLVLGVALTILLNDQLDLTRRNTVESATRRTERNLQDESSLALDSDFSDFVGVWHDCMHTILTTFEGETQEKDLLDKVGCDNTNIGNITKVRDWNDQALQFDLLLLNRCSFHGYGGKGQRPCPNDTLGKHTSDGKILVKYSFKGVGSLAQSSQVQFFADQSYTRDKYGTWRPNLQKAKIENVNSMVCQKYGEGIVCDWHLNDYSTVAVQESSGCQLDEQCKPLLGKRKCQTSGGLWTEACPRTKYVSDGLLSDSFGSVYLVKDVSQCNVDCLEHT